MIAIPMCGFQCNRCDSEMQKLTTVSPMCVSPKRSIPMQQVRFGNAEAHDSESNVCFAQKVNSKATGTIRECRSS